MNSSKESVGRSRDDTGHSSILYCRLPGLLALAARQTRRAEETSSPLIVADGMHVRDACPLALERGVRVHSSVTQARRLCPSALVIPLASIRPERQTVTFLDRLADLSPIVEPDGQDAAYADLTGEDLQTIVGSLTAWATNTFGVAPIIGIGPSRNAARACAECRLTPSHLSEADIAHLWPENPAIPARMKRLGLTNYGQVATVNESLLVHHFGKIGRQLHRRARGIDLTPLRALYPPPRADVRLDLSEHPIGDKTLLDSALLRLTDRAGTELSTLGRFGRRMVFAITTEEGEIRHERVLALPMQASGDLLRAIRYLLSQTTITAPVTALRLLVDDTEIPLTRTLSLFEGREGQSAAILRMTRRTLQQRFGPKALLRLTELPLPQRDIRRQQVREALSVAR